MKLPDVTKDGWRIRPQGGWQAFVDQVQKAAQNKRRKRVNTAANMVGLKKRPPVIVAGVLPERQCVAKAYSTGARCRKRAVVGSERCDVHGGLLDNPAHPANQRALADRYLVTLERVRARTEFAKFPPDIKRQVQEAYRTVRTAKRAAGLGDLRASHRFPILLLGAQALTSDTPARDFQRWMRSIKASKERKTHNGE